MVINAGTDEQQLARISFVQPFQTGSTPFTKARIETEGVHFHPGQFVTAEVTVRSGAKYWIPRHARVYLGTRDVVFLKAAGVFRAHSFVAGQRFGNWVEVVSGIGPADSVAVNAQFMVDRDSFIKIPE